MLSDLPSMTDYREAIERDPSCLLDAELKLGKKPSGTETGTDTIFYAFGYPGDSGVVYFLRCPGNKFYAIKCYVLRRPEPKHYEAVQEYFEREPLALFPSGLQYLNEGIKMGGSVFPLVKMKWVEGMKLDKQIEKHLGDSSRLQALAKQWLSLSHDLRERGISHGNLEAANVLVERSKLTLVDFDTVFVPALDGANSPELGNKNYQHPARKVFHFGPYLDNFSDWIIYNSIFALSVDETLWRFARVGQHLLFQRSDYEKPESSEILSLLKNHKDERLRDMSEWLKELLEMPLDEIPALDPLKRGLIPS